MICLKHNQQYNENEYCIYCGNPQYFPLSTMGTFPILPENKQENKYQSFMVHIGKRSVKKLLKAGNYDGHINSNITNANFPDDTNGDKEVFLFSINETLSTEDVIERMDKEGLKPATIKVGLAFGEQHPDFQRHNLLIALGSVWVGPHGARMALGLWGFGSARSADLHWYGSRWYPHCVFLAVSK